jgi:hypothetical protein
MNLESILAFLAPFAPMLKQELLTLDTEGRTELNALIAEVSSPDLQALLQALASGIDSFAQLEINKL